MASLTGAEATTIPLFSLTMMTTEEINLLQECLDLQKKPFYYFKDQYALRLLSYQIGKGMSVGQVKKSALGFLLDKPLLKMLTAGLGSNLLTKQALQDYWPEKYSLFRLSLGQWGELRKGQHSDWHQTSRPGYSLVLRLNFSHHHDKAYHELMKPQNDEHPFIWGSHPVEEGTRYIMAWVRLDLNWDTGEVLIEEIQNDWLREASSIHSWLLKRYERDKHKVHQHWLFSETNSSFGRFNRYCRDILEPYQEIWEEAALSAAIWLIREELGIEQIFYHTFETGNRIKSIKENLPPWSLYTKLPRRFGFKETIEGPQFLRNVRRLRQLAKTHELRWYRLDLPKRVNVPDKAMSILTA